VARQTGEPGIVGAGEPGIVVPGDSITTVGVVGDFTTLGELGCTTVGVVGDSTSLGESGCTTVGVVGDRVAERERERGGAIEAPKFNTSNNGSAESPWLACGWDAYTRLEISIRLRRSSTSTSPWWLSSPSALSSAWRLLRVARAAVDPVVITAQICMVFAGRKKSLNCTHSLKDECME